MWWNRRWECGKCTISYPPSSSSLERQWLIGKTKNSVQKAPLIHDGTWQSFGECLTDLKLDPDNFEMQGPSPLALLRGHVQPLGIFDTFLRNRASSMRMTIRFGFLRL